MNWRNKLTRAVCNFMLTKVATRDYGEKIDQLIKQGMFHAHMGGPYVIFTGDDPEEPARD